MTGWIVAIVAVALPLVLAAWWIAAGAAKKRGLAKLAKERGWDFFSGARLGSSGGRHEQAATGRAPAPLRRTGESIDQAVVGTHRGVPFGVYRYHQPGAGFRQDGTRESGSLRTVVHVEVGTAMPDCTLSISGSEVDCSNPGFVLRPEVREWLLANVGRCREFHTSGRTVAVVPKSLPSGPRLLRTLDYLTDVAGQVPLNRV
ncbi:hypothetical protein SAMN04489729_4170 [Amycolatopsis lurida]|uniref:Uncharacterized protein n=1 Tax=Amycolatopsis lurida NRRL 2430 TaxID=1460371 RepID=A0A2P2G1Y9_AMYLU|nr:hypothetical protein [Amycolatopsis lurida]KFU82988.1 hypothetical protein BB31_00435 [Amycolatopsis lurida NRRL 2430]SED37505.1 hypothetical protein SAMN04489729_4170 [Amycolatopsis lurida]